MSELNISVSVNLLKSTYLKKYMSMALASDLTGSLIACGPQLITTSWAAVNLGNVASLGYLFFYNIDATNYIEFSADNAGANKLAMARALQGGFFEVASAAIYAKANVASCLLDYMLFSH